MQKISARNAEHYTWNGISGHQCDAWYLVRGPELNVIEEVMPPGASEHAHYHTRARQFFFVLQGDLTIRIDEHEQALAVGEGLEIPPGKVHRAFNASAGGVRFLVISQPPSHFDRIDI